MAGYEKSIEYLKAMKEPGNTILTVPHDDIPKNFPMEHKEGEPKLAFGLKGIVAGGLMGALAAKAVQSTPFGKSTRNKAVYGFGIGAGAGLGLAKNLIDYGRENSGKKNNKISTTKKKKQS